MKNIEVTDSAMEYFAAIARKSTEAGKPTTASEVVDVMIDMFATARRLTTNPDDYHVVAIDRRAFECVRAMMAALAQMNMPATPATAIRQYDEMADVLFHLMDCRACRARFLNDPHARINNHGRGRQNEKSKTALN